MGIFALGGWPLPLRGVGEKERERGRKTSFFRDSFVGDRERHPLFGNHTEGKTNMRNKGGSQIDT